MTTIIQNQAQSVEVNTTETFDQFATRIFKDSKRPVRFKNGADIELDPKLEYSFLMLGLTQLATPQEFEVLFTAIMGAIAQAESQGLIPAGWVKTVATPFDVLPPKIPNKFADEIGNATLKTLLVGEVGFAVVKEEPPEPE